MPKRGSSFIFRDLTTGHGTYGAGRFLHAAPEEWKHRARLQQGIQSAVRFYAIRNLSAAAATEPAAC